MACDYFEEFSPWQIVATTERVVFPFEPDNWVTISPGEQRGAFVVTVTADGKDYPYPGFTCTGDNQLFGTAGEQPTPLLIVGIPKPTPTDKNKTRGFWNPTAATQGTWTGNEGGGHAEEALNRS